MDMFLLAVDNVQVGMEAFTDLTPTAILGWYAWYTSTKSIPRAQKQFTENYRKSYKNQISKQH